jgi:NADP-dependent 3-hydroxy acid dehydrogenase YdfG
VIKKQNYQDKIIWVIGASSGIGEALVKELASRGAVLALSARRTDELKKLKNSLKGLRHEVFSLDVSELSAVINTAEAIYIKFGRIDSIIFLAAVYSPMKLDNLDPRAIQQMVEINLLGALHVVHAVLPIVKKQSYGQIALCGSVAGYLGLPGGQPYSATKAGIINLAESLRAELPEPIDIKLISPGFVRTALTDKNNFSMPMMISPTQAAVFIADGLLKNVFEVHFPKRFTWSLKLLQLLPYKLLLKITSKLNQ